MKITSVLCLAPLAVAAVHAQAADRFPAGYYASAKYLQSEQRASELDTSSRPGVGAFVSGKEKERLGGAALAAGYQFGNGWRVEGEYRLRQKTAFTSGSTLFPRSVNHLQVETDSLMLHVYRDYALGYGFSLYGTLGLGVSNIQAGGWQGVTSREYASSTQHNLTYALGAGVSYAVRASLNIDLGYRYVDWGKIESGYNNFTNVRGLKDEQIKARLVSNELTLGVRYLF
ncbi:outer membrane protein [Pantoea sp. 1.19]|uniref:outer membrane protein n=1 Tax=Pantoea sp. 1.19 TaxID=1925589 RepID=UPI000948D409|nr:outer membrane beta-barrel protein [Pantoea sp. 1.19]